MYFFIKLYHLDNNAFSKFHRDHLTIAEKNKTIKTVREAWENFFKLSIRGVQENALPN